MKPWLKLGSVALTLALLAACSSGIQDTTEPTIGMQADSQFYGRISTSSDDAEQYQSSSVSVSSSDLDLGSSSTGATTVGLRYIDITIPPGATITEAYISFIPAETRSTAATFTFRGQGTSSTGTFSAVTNDLSRRPLTSASVTWSAPAWTASTTFPGDGSGRSANLKTIVQEVVSRSGWASGSSIAFFVTGTGKRLAHSFESTGKSPALFVKYTTGTNPPPGPRTGFPTKVNPSFSVTDIANTTTRNYYNELLSKIDVDNNVTSCSSIPEDSGFVDTGNWNKVACSNNNYVYGRGLQNHIGGLLDIFRLTGDQRLLKEIDRLMELAKDQLGTFSGGSGYRQWKPKLGQGVSSASEWRKRFLDDVLAHTLVARVAVALQENAGIPGTSYGAHAQEWKSYLTGAGGYEKKWQQEEGTSFPFIAAPPYGLGQSRTWNYGAANLAHIYINHIMYLHYVGKLTGDSRYTNEASEMISNWTRLKVDNVVDAYVWPHATIVPDADDGDTGRLRFAPIVYSGYTINAAIDLALDGQPFFDSETKMARFSRTVSHHILDEVQFNNGDLVDPYRNTIGSNRSNWKYGMNCNQTTPTKIIATSSSKCVDIDGVRFFEGSSANTPDLYSGAYNYVSAWPKKSSLGTLESSKVYTFHAAARNNSTQRQKDELRYQGLKSFIFSRLWVEGGYTLN